MIGVKMEIRAVIGPVVKGKHGNGIKRITAIGSNCLIELEIGNKSTIRPHTHTPHPKIHAFDEVAFEETFGHCADPILKEILVD